MATKTRALAHIFTALILAMILNSCGGSSMTSATEETPATTTDTVYEQLIGNYKLAGNRDFDNSGQSSHILRPTWNVGGQLWTNLPADQGKVIHIPVKNKQGSLKIGYYTDVPVRNTHENMWEWKQIDREQAAGRPVPSYLTELGTSKDAVIYSYNGSEELTGATVQWLPGLPFGIKIPLRNNVEATPQGLGEMGARLNGIQLAAAFAQKTITIHQRTENWWVALAEAAIELAVAAPAACPGEENNSYAIFDDEGGNGTTTVNQHTLYLDLNPTSGPVGTMVTVSLTGDCPDVITVTSSNGGSWTNLHVPTSFTYTIPAGTPAGSIIFTATGCETPKSKTFTVTAPSAENQPPTVNLTADKTSGVAPLTVNFTASANDSDGTIVKYEWDLDGNGSYETDTDTTNTTTHVFTAVGSVTVKVRVTDNDGATGTDTLTITANNGGLQLNGQDFDPARLKVTINPPTMTLWKSSHDKDNPDVTITYQHPTQGEIPLWGPFQFDWSGYSWITSSGYIDADLAPAGTYTDVKLTVTVNTTPTATVKIVYYTVNFNN